MDEEKYQKELFEFEKPKRFFPKLSDFFPKADFERNVVLTLTLDRAVFIAIGIIMVMVVVYAFGVEAGKTKAEQAAPERVPAVQVAVPVTPVVVSSANAVRVQPITKAPPAVKAQAVPVYAVKVQPVAKVTPVAKPYTIVAVTFARRDNAIQEIYKIKKLGYDAILAQAGNYFTVCVGAYSDKTSPEAQKDLKKLKRFYKDAYLKLR